MRSNFVSQYEMAKFSVHNSRVNIVLTTWKSVQVLSLILNKNNFFVREDVKLSCIMFKVKMFRYYYFEYSFFSLCGIRLGIDGRVHL